MWRKQGAILRPAAGLGWATVVLCITGLASGAELRLRPEAQVSAAVVCLGHLAEISGCDVAERDRLAEIELFPVPPPGRQRFISAREISDALVTRGESPAQHTLAGASQIRVRLATERAAPAPRRSAEGRGPSRAQTERATNLAKEAIAAFLAQQAGDGSAWLVEVTLDPETIEPLARAHAVRAEGTAPAAEGNTSLVLIYDSAAGEATCQVTARVQAVPAVVVATRALPRGTILTAGDVRLAAAQEPVAGQEPLALVDDAIGHEVTRALGAGQAIAAGDVRAPLLVRRGEPVTVWARAAGLRVRTVAVAREEGGAGDLVTVESRQTRQTFFARVVGPQEVEVYARRGDAAGWDASGRNGEGAR